MRSPASGRHDYGGKDHDYAGNRLTVQIGSDHMLDRTPADQDMMVFNQGITPFDGLPFDLKPLSRNAGRVDQRALLEGKGTVFPQVQPDIGLDLYRIGDAAAGRNVPTAIDEANWTGRLW